jgi:hypothetical protein
MVLAYPPEKLNQEFGLVGIVIAQSPIARPSTWELWKHCSITSFVEMQKTGWKFDLRWVSISGTVNDLNSPAWWSWHGLAATLPCLQGCRVSPRFKANVLLACAGFKWRQERWNGGDQLKCWNMLKVETMCQHGSAMLSMYLCYLQQSFSCLDCWWHRTRKRKTQPSIWDDGCPVGSAAVIVFPQFAFQLKFRDGPSLKFESHVNGFGPESPWRYFP